MIDNVYGQATSAGNSNQPVSVAPLDYLGWDNITYYPLEIRTEVSNPPQPINFYTNYGTQRLQIFEDAADTTGGAYSGNIAVGNFYYFIPRSLLHQHIPYDGDNYHQFTNAGTYSLLDSFGQPVILDTNGLKVGINAYGIAEIRQQELLPLDFYTSNKRWMQLDPTGRLGISNTWSSFTPQEHFHLHGGTDTLTHIQISDDVTGYSTTDGFHIGITKHLPGTTYPVYGTAEVIQNEQAPILFYSRANMASGTVRERLRISNGLGGDGYGGIYNDSGVTKISISHDGIGNFYLPQPVSMLNIGAPFSVVL